MQLILFFFLKKKVQIQSALKKIALLNAKEINNKHFEINNNDLCKNPIQNFDKVEIEFEYDLIPIIDENQQISDKFIKKSIKEENFKFKKRIQFFHSLTQV